MDAKREEQLVTIGSEDELANTLEELVLVDGAVVIAIERGEHALREVFAAQAERRAEVVQVDAPIFARVLGERALQRVEHASIDVVALRRQFTSSTPRRRSGAMR